MARIYLDHAATTPVDPEVARVMYEACTSFYGNPSSVHTTGREARRRVDEAREAVAALIGAEPREILFFSGGTEADNVALMGVARANRDRGDHVITSAVEHEAVLRACERLASEGWRVTVLPVDAYGRVDPDALREAIDDRTVLVSIMTANNEIGTIQPIAELAAIARGRGVLFHTDAVQAVGQMPIDVGALGVDLLTLSGHKIYGPKGVGALYVRRGVRLDPILFGGSQERRVRPGTENVPGIAGLGKAAELARRDLATRIEHVRRLRDRFVAEVKARLPEARLNGHPTERVPNNANFSFEGADGETLLLNLDLHGIDASSGSACTAGSLDPSHVLLALGLDRELARSAVRFSFGRGNTEADVERTVEALVTIVAKLRAREGALRASR